MICPRRYTLTTWINFNLNLKNSLWNWHSYMEQLSVWVLFFKRILYFYAMYVKSHTHTHTHTHPSLRDSLQPWSPAILIQQFTLTPLREIIIQTKIPSQVNQTLVTWDMRETTRQRKQKQTYQRVPKNDAARYQTSQRQSWHGPREWAQNIWMMTAHWRTPILGDKSQRKKSLNWGVRSR